MIPRGWLVAAALRGDPEPDAEMRERSALFERGTVAAFGAWLLGAWIERDTAVGELTDERRAELRGIAERAAELALRFGRGGTDPEERFRQLVAQEEDRPAPSALGSPGCPGGRAWSRVSAGACRMSPTSSVSRGPAPRAAGAVPRAPQDAVVDRR